jgi:hypothetical protein
MMLVEEGRIGLHDPLGNYLPEWREPRDLERAEGGPAGADPVFREVKAEREITIHGLLSPTLPVSSMAWCTSSRLPSARGPRSAGWRT